MKNYPFVKLHTYTLTKNNDNQMLLKRLALFTSNVNRKQKCAHYTYKTKLN